MQVGVPAENFTGFISLFIARKLFPAVHEGSCDHGAHKHLADEIAAEQTKNAGALCRTPGILRNALLSLWAKPKDRDHFR